MILKKLNTIFTNPIQYYLVEDSKNSIFLNKCIGKTIQLDWTGRIFCRTCKKNTKKSFGEGFCFSCFSNAPEASPCILRPELCEAHLGIGRDVEYEQKNHNQPHFVYLTANDVVKVGITRSTQIPTRWIDQGASEAIIIAEVPNRYTAGIIEVALKEFYSDRTNWRKMLTNLNDKSIDLVEEKWKIEEIISQDLANYWSEDDSLTHLNYPIEQYPSKVNSINLDKKPSIKGELTGIRGQYLYLNEDVVFNVRRHTSYEVEIQFNG